MATILTYHRVSSTVKGSINDYLSISPFNFSKQMKYLATNFEVVSLDFLIYLLNSNNLEHVSKPVVVITFDDGYSDFTEFALPILERFNLPSIVYVSTSFCEHSGRLWWYEIEDIINYADVIAFTWQSNSYEFNTKSLSKKHIFRMLRKLMMQLNNSQQQVLLDILWRCTGIVPKNNYAKMLSWEEIQELDKHPLVTIGAHTHMHSPLSSLKDQEALEDLQKGKLLLEQKLGHAIDNVAYPFGSPDAVSAREYVLAMKCGFKTAVTTNPRNINNYQGAALFALPRISITNDRPCIYRLKTALSGYETILKQIMSNYKL